MGIARLREDLKILRSVEKNGTAYYLVEDHLAGEVLTFRDEEMYLCTQLAECNNLADVRSRFMQQFQKPLEQNQLEAFVRYLAQRKLLADQPGIAESRWEGFQFQSPETWNRWSLVNPSNFLLSMANRLRWLYTRPFVIASIVVFAIAFFTVFFNFTAVWNDLKSLVFTQNVFQILALMYIFINMPGELVRGITSSRFRGYCEEFGIWLSYNIMPRFYCFANVWDIPLKSQRSWTLFSPSFYAILVGSIGIIIWKITPAHIYLHKLGITIAFISFLDSIIRLNFLWPAEGHYIISNYIEKDDFRRRAVRTFKSFLFRTPLVEPLSRSDRNVFITYGLLTLLLTFPCLAVFAYFVGKKLIVSYAGLGAMFFAAVISIKYRKGISGFIRGINMAQWIENLKNDVKKRNRYALWGIIIIIILLFPYPYDTSGPFKILAVERTELHALVPGEIKRVLVKENDSVQKGSVQAIIDPYEHKKNLDAAQADLDKERENLRMMENGPKPEDVKKAQDEVERARTASIYSRKEEVRLQSLYKEGVIALEEYDEAARTADVDEKTLAVATSNLAVVKSWPRPEEKEAQKALVRQREAQVKYYGENMQLTELKAPINGRVITPQVELKAGQYLKAGDLFAIYENSAEARVEVQLPEADIYQIENGGKVRFKLQAYPLHTFEGTVVLIAPVAEELPNGRVVRVLLKVPNEKNELKAETSGQAKIDGGWKPVIVAFTRPVVRFVMVEIWSWFP